LKSPTTETSAAFGAKTPNATPSFPARVSTCEPSFSQRRVWLPWWKRKRSSGVKRDVGDVCPASISPGSFVLGVLSARQPPWTSAV